MVSKIEPDRYANTGFSIADTPADLNDHLFQRMMEKTGAERLIMGCQMADTARELVWSGIPKNLPTNERRNLFLARFYTSAVEHQETTPSSTPPKAKSNTPKPRKTPAPSKR